MIERWDKGTLHLDLELADIVDFTSVPASFVTYDRQVSEVSVLGFIQKSYS